MSKLLNRPLKAFVLYALLVLAVSIPVYYAVVDYIWLDELDENNQIVRQRIENGFKNSELTEVELELLLKSWSIIQPGSSISPAAINTAKDSVYTEKKVNPYSIDGEVNRFRVLLTTFTINGRPYYLRIATNIEETHETVFAISIVTILFFVLLVTGFILLNRYISFKLWRPFYSILDRLKRFDLSKNSGVHSENTDIEEFTELIAALNVLIERNLTIYNQQKEFIENASHELQTPLAILKSKIDLLQQDKTLTSTQSESIAALNIPLSRVSRINKNILLLAKIENNQFGETETVNLSEMVNENVELLTELFAEKKLNVTKTVLPAITITGNKALAEVLLTNLLGNTIRHTDNGGKISIVLTNDALAISNTGKQPLNPETLFTRFKSASSATPGSGLGLAIVKQICKRYGWNISYRHNGEMHTFLVKL